MSARSTTAWLLACYAVLSGSAMAQQGSIVGAVRSQEGPVTGAFVTATAGDIVVARDVTDAQGGYELPRLDAGEYSVVVQLAGFAERRIDAVRVIAGTAVVLDIDLVAVAFSLEGIAVTALRRTEKAIEAPASIAIIDERRIRERTAVSAMDYAVGLAGVDAAVQGLQSRQIVTRGFNQLFGGSLLMLTDYRAASIPSLRANLSHFLTPVADDVARIEVLRGPASALYGPNAADGVVHFITRSPFESAGSSASLVGGSRSLLHATLRHAQVAGDRVAFKVSGQYFRGREWPAPADPTEQTERDPQIERLSGEARIDFRVTPGTNAVLTVGSTLAIRNVEQTAIGASQVKDWRYDFAHLRLGSGRFFAQAYINSNSAGETFNLQTLEKLYDRSNLFVAQVQHGVDLAGSTITLGLDFQRTTPRTAGTISGRNEDDDTSVETGAYTQVETPLSGRWTLLTSARLDHHDRVEGVQLSPRMGLLFSPREGHGLRLTYNRAFSMPTSTDLFLDIAAARLDPLPFTVRAVGVPKGGFRFARDCGGLCMASPFAPGQRLPIDATLLWPAVVQIMQANGVDLSGLPAPTGADVGTVLRTLDPSSGTFATSGEPADIEPLSPTVTNSIEFGYRGLYGGRLLLDVAAFYTRRVDFRGPLGIETPNVFLATSDLAAYLSRFMPAEQAQALAAGIGGIDGNAAVTGIPLATIGPDHLLAGPDILLTYRSFGEVDLWGAELAAELLVGPRFSVRGAWSFLSKNFFSKQELGTADLALNAPKHKGAIAGRYEFPSGTTAEMRGRFVDDFRMVEGVWIGDVPAFAVVDAELGLAVPGLRGARLTFSLQNLTNDRHSEFIGAPVLGRMFLTRLHYFF